MGGGAGPKKPPPPKPAPYASTKKVGEGEMSVGCVECMLVCVSVVVYLHDRMHFCLCITLRSLSVPTPDCSSPPLPSPPRPLVQAPVSVPASDGSGKQKGSDGSDISDASSDDTDATT